MQTVPKLGCLSAVAPLLFACGSAGELEPVDSIIDEVQTAYMAHYFIDKSQRDSLLATGASFTPFRNADPNHTFVLKDGIQVRGTCGVTFVTGKYAISAAHCFDDQHIVNPATDTFPVRTYDVSTMSDNVLASAQQLNGTPYPNWSSAHHFSAAEGYAVSTFNCRIIARCDPTHGLFGPCHDENNVNFQADIALIKCDDRPENAPALPVAPVDPEVGPVEMNWPHEVYRVPTQDSADPVLHDRFQHYTFLGFNQQPENFHYLGAFPGGPEKNQLLPLRASRWVTGAPRTRVGIEGTMVWTDLFGCHGTSGAGVLQQNVTGGHELLGPVTRGSGPWGARLCIQANLSQPGQQLLAYTKTKFTRALTAWAMANP